MFATLWKLKRLCDKKQIINLACPRLGCELDKLSWEVVRNMLRYLFRGAQTKVFVYTKVELSEEEKQSLIKEYHENPLGGHQGTTRTFNRLYAQ